MPTFADRFGFETEVVTRVAWAGGSVRQWPVKCIYEVVGGRVAFPAVAHSFSASFMHIRLLSRSVLPWRVGKTVNESTDYGTVFERLLNWFSPILYVSPDENQPGRARKTGIRRGDEGVHRNGAGVRIENGSLPRSGEDHEGATLAADHEFDGA